MIKPEYVISLTDEQKQALETASREAVMYNGQIIATIDRENPESFLIAVISQDKANKVEEICALKALF